MSAWNATTHRGGKHWPTHKAKARARRRSGARPLPAQPRPEVKR